MHLVTQFSGARDHSRSVHFRALFDGAAFGIAICRLDGRILEANAMLGKMLDCGPREPTANRDSETSRSDLDPANFEPALFRPEQVWLERFLPSPELLDELIRGELESLEIERCFRRRDGSEFCGLATLSLGRNEHREAAFLLASLIDATERKRCEERLRSAEKMEIFGRAAGAIAHDFNNLLTGILLYCDLMSTGLENGTLGLRELTRHIEEVRLAGEQGAGLTQQLLAMARKEVVAPVPIALDDLVTGSKNLLRRLIGERIELLVSLGSGERRVMADPGQLRQVLLNLVLNARDALPRGGRITVTTNIVEAGTTETEPSVSLAVKDNGSGMDAETRRRLFEPFFTTKNPGVGTGLGLATVNRIVTGAGGKIVLDSELGRGTCVEVILPAVDAGGCAMRPILASLAATAHD